MEINNVVNEKSILGSACSIFFAWIGQITTANLQTAAIVISIFAGLFTIIYTGIKIYKEFKNKNL